MLIEFHLDAAPASRRICSSCSRSAGAAPRDPAARRPAADREGGRRQAGDQPEHGAEGLPRARARRARRGPAAGRAHSFRRRSAVAVARPRALRRRWPAGSSGARTAGLDEETIPALFVEHRCAALLGGGGMSTCRTAAGSRQALRRALGAARLHARDPRRLGHGARRAKRRRQNDPAAPRGRFDGRRREVSVLGESPRDEPRARAAADRLRRAGPSALSRFTPPRC